MFTMFAVARHVDLGAEGHRRVAVDPSTRVRAEAVQLRSMPVAELVRMTADPEPAVRATACDRAWPYLSAGARQRLLNDPAGRVRARALLRRHRTSPLSREVFDAEGLGVDALRTCRLSRTFFEELAGHEDPRQRSAAAANPWLPPDLVALLARDPDQGVRWVTSLRADLTEDERSRIPVEYDPDGHYPVLEWVTVLHGDEGAMRRLARSSHFLVRRSVARARRLPTDAVELLAGDEDRVVRLFLAESCDDAPGDMLLEVWRWWTGSLTCPDRPRGHPGFPRAGLLRFAEDPDPRMRRLAPDDPASTAELVERLSHDPAGEVRLRAASDARLGAASLVRLTADPEGGVRYAATVHPALPVPVLVRLLRDPATARHAAANPSLPSDVVHRMIDLVLMDD
ncbi:PE-PGRS family protein [Streptomyces sp. NPDC006798]|uniref:PE-PGRS family protein n=1 Tax=Streptomyces sp. NPDC006798 TaxID=3155462 RepID=UPI0033D11D6D